MENPAAHLGCGVFLLEFEYIDEHKGGSTSPLFEEMRRRPVIWLLADAVD